MLEEVGDHPVVVDLQRAVAGLRMDELTVLPRARGAVLRREEHRLVDACAQQRHQPLRSQGRGSGLAIESGWWWGVYGLCTRRRSR